MSFGSSPPTPKPPPDPPAAPPAPDRSDEETQKRAVEQRKKYGIPGGATNNMGTGGMGVASSSIYSAVTSMLGGGTA